MRKETYTLEEADYAFGGINSVSEEFRVILARATSKLPKDIIDWTAENLVFLSSSDEYWFLYRKLNGTISKGSFFSLKA